MRNFSIFSVQIEEVINEWVFSKINDLGGDLENQQVEFNKMLKKLDQFWLNIFPYLLIPNL